MVSKNIFFNSLRRISVISNPWLWVYSVGVYFLGLILGSSYQSGSLSVGMEPIFLFALWFLSAGIIMGFAHLEGYSDIIFPHDIVISGVSVIWGWELFSGFRKRLDTNDGKISFAVSAASLLFFISANALYFDWLIFFVGTGIYLIDFLYNSKIIYGKHRPILDIGCGVIYMIPLLIGYIITAGKLPPSQLIFAGSIYCIALELYAITVGSDLYLKNGHGASAVFLGKKLSILGSAFLAMICGLILAEYDPMYFLAVAPLLSMLFLSSIVKNHNELKRIYSFSYAINSTWGFIIALYMSFKL